MNIDVLTNRIILLVLLVEALMGGLAHAEQGKFIGILPGEFLDPSGVAVSPSALYVVDSGNSQIHKYVVDFRNSQIKSINPNWGGGGFGSGDGQFIAPSGIAVDGEGYVYVADTGNDRIQKFKPDGTLARIWGSTGSGNNEFSSPSGIAVDPQGFVYVVDSGNNRIQKFTKYGKLVGKPWGGFGSGDGQFQLLSVPSGVAVSPTGVYVYVADIYNNRIQKFTSDGRFFSIILGKPGDFNSPCGVAVDAQGYVYVVDSVNNGIYKFGPSGESKGSWTSVVGSAPGFFNFPTWAAATSVNSIYVTNSGNKRIEEYATR